jgi:signal transduction histidine kinase
MNPVPIASEPIRRLSDTASIVHDLRNPLATIHGGAEMLVRSKLSQAQIVRVARAIYCASVRMRELLDEFLDESRVTERKAELSDLRELVACAVDEISESAEFQSVHIERFLPEGLYVVVDRQRIVRVLVNLLVNALQAMPRGGTIHLSAVSDCRSVLIRVRDSGPGIAPEITDRLFQPFATAGKPNGIGLGLTLSRQAVLEHGGDICVESSREGACFAVRLPLPAERRTIAKSVGF